MALSVPTFRTVRRTISAGGRSVRISPTPLQDANLRPAGPDHARGAAPTVVDETLATAFVRFVTLTVCFRRSGAGGTAEFPHIEAELAAYRLRSPRSVWSETAVMHAASSAATEPPHVDVGGGRRRRSRNAQRVTLSTTKPQAPTTRMAPADRRRRGGHACSG